VPFGVKLSINGQFKPNGMVSDNGQASNV